MSDRDAVAGVVKIYFDGLYHADARRLADAFHPKAIYVTADETPLLHRTMDDYFREVEQRESPAARGETRRDVIDVIEFAGDNTAFARVRCSIGPRDFIDFLTLVRADGAWRIMSKVFHFIEREEREKPRCPT